MNWLQAWDTNTKFFHQSTLQRRRCNKVLKLKDDQGVWHKHPSRVQKLIDKHFMQLFTSAGQRYWGSMLDCISPKITTQMNVVLKASISREEILAAAKQMGALKAPGPDGFQGIFYQSFWGSLEEEVLGLVEDLMTSTYSPHRINSTHVVLIPKVPNSDCVSQFTPISLCNYSYKILSKVLANRLRPFLPEIISCLQNAFVAGSQIQDNIGIAHEVFHFLKT